MKVYLIYRQHGIKHILEIHDRKRFANEFKGKYLAHVCQILSLCLLRDSIFFFFKSLFEKYYTGGNKKFSYYSKIRAKFLKITSNPDLYLL
jgi:hypothetical protein